MDLVTALLACLATARLTRLVTIDYLTQPLRELFVMRFGAESRITYLVFCPWCVSVYVGAGVAAAWALLGSSLWFLVPALMLSASHVAGFLINTEDD